MPCNLTKLAKKTVIEIQQEGLGKYNFQVNKSQVPYATQDGSQRLPHTQILKRIQEKHNVNQVNKAY